MTRPGEIAITHIEDIDALRPLAAAATDEGHRMVNRLIEEWHEGTNRFNDPGEVLLDAKDVSNIVAVCGLNRDPYASDPRVGRVRRLYVAPTHRRRGIASLLLRAILRQAKSHFDVLHVRTSNPEADHFYRHLGFSTIEADVFCT
ncbi:MAG: GNAT family N-acetyltransferase, partial [Planctomycetota bacterium]